MGNAQGRARRGRMRRFDDQVDGAGHDSTGYTTSTTGYTTTAATGYATTGHTMDHTTTDNTTTPLPTDITTTIYPSSTHDRAALVRACDAGLLAPADAPVPDGPDFPECPICLLCFPALNLARCCLHPICSHCFVQIRRAAPAFDPPVCPFCVQPDFGVVYFQKGASPVQKDATDPSVCTCDYIYPNWKKEKHQAAVNRALNIHSNPSHPAPSAPLFRQADISTATSAAADLLESLSRLDYASSPSEQRAARRAVRNAQRESPFRYLQAMQHMGADIEELMVLEAIRQSLMEDDPNSNSASQLDTSAPDRNNPAADNSGNPSGNASRDFASGNSSREIATGNASRIIPTGSTTSEFVPGNTTGSVVAEQSTTENISASNIIAPIAVLDSTQSALNPATQSSPEETTASTSMDISHTHVNASTLPDQPTPLLTTQTDTISMNHVESTQSAQINFTLPTQSVATFATSSTHVATLGNNSFTLPASQTTPTTNLAESLPPLQASHIPHNPLPNVSMDASSLLNMQSLGHSLNAALVNSNSSSSSYAHSNHLASSITTDAYTHPHAVLPAKIHPASPSAAINPSIAYSDNRLSSLENQQTLNNILLPSSTLPNPVDQLVPATQLPPENQFLLANPSNPDNQLLPNNQHFSNNQSPHAINTHSSNSTDSPGSSNADADASSSIQSNTESTPSLLHSGTLNAPPSIFSIESNQGETSSLRTDRFVHMTLEHRHDDVQSHLPAIASDDRASEITTTNDMSIPTHSASGINTTSVRIVSVHGHDVGARDRRMADDAVSFDSLAARKSLKSEFGDVSVDVDEDDDNHDDDEDASAHPSSSTSAGVAADTIVEADPVADAVVAAGTSVEMDQDSVAVSTNATPVLSSSRPDPANLSDVLRTLTNPLHTSTTAESSSSVPSSDCTHIQSPPT